MSQQVKEQHRQAWGSLLRTHTAGAGIYHFSTYILGWEAERRNVWKLESQRPQSTQSSRNKRLCFNEVEREK